MKKNIMFTVFLCVLYLSSYAQNLNPEVVVENAYVPSVTDMDRHSVSMSIPDSLHDFDYHFDYSVFESQYRGTYDFRPYSVTVKPEPEMPDNRRFYLKCGAGYVLRPEFDLFWAPVSTENFVLTLSENASGYYGQYGIYSLEDDRFIPGGNPDYDFVNHTDLQARALIGKSLFKADLGYDGFFASELYCAGGIAHSPYAKLRLSSVSERSNKFHYDLGVAYRFLSDRFTDGRTSCFDLDIDGRAGGVFTSKKLSCLLDFRVFGGTYYSAIDLAPHVDLVFGPMNLSVGVRFGMDKDATESGIHAKFYPDIKASVNAVGDHLQVYAYAGGGPKYLSYYDFKSDETRFNLSYCTPSVSFERFDFGGGIRGQLFSKFQYDVRAGYRKNENSPLYTVGYGTVDQGIMYHEYIRYSDFNTFYVDGSMLWHSERFDADLNLKYQNTTELRIESKYDDSVFVPSRFSGSVKFTYNWSRRVFVHVSASAAESRKAETVTYVNLIPGYVDLGAGLEYRVNRVLSVWARGGNLLNMYCAKTPLYREKGVSGTLGVVVNL